MGKQNNTKVKGFSIHHDGFGRRACDWNSGGLN